MMVWTMINGHVAQCWFLNCPSVNKWHSVGHRDQDGKFTMVNLRERCTHHRRSFLLKGEGPFWRPLYYKMDAEMSLHLLLRGVNQKPVIQLKSITWRFVSLALLHPYEQGYRPKPRPHFEASPLLLKAWLSRPSSSSSSSFLFVYPSSSSFGAVPPPPPNLGFSRPSSFDPERANTPRTPIWIDSNPVSSDNLVTVILIARNWSGLITRASGKSYQ